MSIETLQQDLRDNLAALQTFNPDNPAALALHLKESLWPFLESLVEEMAEIDDCVADIVGGHEDILHPETAAVFAAVLAGGAAVAAALKLRISKEADPQLMKVVTELEGNIAKANGIMQEIVIDDGEDLDGDDDDDEGEDEDDDEDEEKR